MDDPLWEQWKANWKWITDALFRHGCEASGPIIAPPATAADVVAVERECGITFPLDFVENLTQRAASVALYWRAVRRSEGTLRRYDANKEDWHRFPGPYRAIFSGWSDYLWDLASYPQLLKSFYGMQEAFPREPSHEEELYWDEDWEWYNGLWHDKLPLLEVPNGDFLVFDLTQGTYAARPIIYLSHEGDEDHGMRLAGSFTEFLTRWSALGCPGPEDWQLRVFYEEASDSISAESTVADEWRRLINMPEPWFPAR